MTIQYIPTQEELRAHEADGWLRSSRHPTLPLTIWCYTHACQYENHWNDVTKVTRGIVFDDDGNLIQLPLQKMFNVGDPNAPVIGRRPFLAFDKMDGSLIMVSLYKGNAVVTTKGSFTSPQALAAQEFVKGWSPPEGHTVMFEYIAPDNRIVVDYEGFEGLVLLGAVRHEDGYDAFNPHQVSYDTGWYGEVVPTRTFSLPTMLGDIANPENGENREGFVVLVENENGPSDRVKLKFAKYVEMHALLSGLTNRRVWELLRDGTLDQYAAAFPDEMFDAINEYANDVLREVERVLSVAEQLADEAEVLYDNRKDHAQFIQATEPEKAVQSAAFAYLDDNMDKAREIAFRAAEPDQSQPLVQQPG